MSSQPCPLCGQPTSDDAPAARPGGTMTVGPPGAPPSAPPPSAAPASVERIGRFEVRRSLGEGAFGRVYEAYDPALERPVALKVAKPEQLASPQRAGRFLREAKAAAHLTHANIVAVFDAGQDGPHHYIASAYVPGRSLAVALEALPQGQLLPLADAVRIVRRLAEALAYAHARGVVHRDVKPANVMLRDDGEPLLMDFGLAARGEEDNKLTVAGQFMGTPAYAAPEQWKGEATAASDQYSLGCLLYELLTGQPPFCGNSPAHYLWLHTQSAPPSPRSPRPGLPRDLETIALKCLEKEQHRRYKDCQALADDLRRWAEGEPVLARPPGPVERLAMWARRNPLVAWLLAVVFLSLAVGASVATAFWLQARDEAEKAKQARSDFENKAIEEKQQRQLAQRREKEAKQQAYRADITLHASRMQAAQRALVEGKVALAEEQLDAVPTALQQAWEYRFLRGQCRRLALPLYGHPATIHAIAFSPDGSRLLSTGSGGKALVHGTYTGRELLSLPCPAEGLYAAAFNPDGKLVVTAGAGRVARAYSAETGKFLFSLAGHAGAINCLAISPDGKHLATAGEDRTVRLWPMRPGASSRTLETAVGPFFAVAFSPDGKRLACGGAPGLLRVLALEGQPAGPLEFRGAMGAVKGVAWSPDGTHLASADEDRKLIVWDVATQKAVRSVQAHEGVVVSVAYRRDGAQLITAGHDETAAIWDARTLQLVVRLRGHSRTVNAAAFSPDGRRAATAGSDSRVRVWEPTVPAEDFRIGLPTPFFSEALAYSPNGESFAIDGPDSGAQVYRAEDGEQRLRIQRAHTLQIKSVAFSPDGRAIVSAGMDGAVRVWSARTGKPRASFLNEHKGGALVALYSPCGKWLVSGGRDPLVRIREAKTGQAVQALQGFPLGVVGLAFGQGRLACCGQEGTARVYALEGGKELYAVSGSSDAVLCAAFSPDGKWLVTGGQDGAIRAWRAEDGKEAYARPGAHKDGACRVAFTPDGARIISAGWDGMVRVWDVPTGEQLLAFKAHSDIILNMALRPDGQQAVTVSLDRTHKAWDASPGRYRLRLAGHSDWVAALAFSPDGRRLASGGADRRVRLWDARTGELLRTFVGGKESITGVRFTEDGRRVEAVDLARKAMAWNADSGERSTARAWGKEPARTVAVLGSERAVAFGRLILVERILGAEELKKARLRQERLYQARRGAGK